MYLRMKLFPLLYEEKQLKRRLERILCERVLLLEERIDLNFAMLFLSIKNSNVGTRAFSGIDCL